VIGENLDMLMHSMTNAYYKEVRRGSAQSPRFDLARRSLAPPQGNPSKSCFPARILCSQFCKLVHINFVSSERRFFNVFSGAELF